MTVHGTSWSSPRSLGDVRVDRELLLASPRQLTSEMLSAAPGFFVDHEDGEGLGNDVYLRGFDLDHGSGIEMRVGSVPINVPMHILGQGYADVNFIIPEVVRGVRVLEGPYDPRQGDAAIVGSAIFDLGVLERGSQVKATYGSFGQARVVGVLAPREASDETFLAFSLRKTNGFGVDRAGESASVNAQLGLDLGASDHLRVLATAYATRFDLPGVVRQDDVDAGRIDAYGAYPYFSANQGIAAGRVIVGADLEHATGTGARWSVSPWFMWTNLRARQNFTGDLDSSNLFPASPSLGDLFQTTNVETALGMTARGRFAPLRAGPVEVVLEPGLSLRGGHTDQTKDLVAPTNLQIWDERVDATLETLDLAAYVDLDARFWKRLRVAGGVRADLLAVSIDDHLANTAATTAPPSTSALGVAPGPRAVVSYEIAPALVPVVSIGEGFRSLDAQSIECAKSSSGGAAQACGGGSPYSAVTSVEAGLRSDLGKGKLVTTLSAFQTKVGNELVFEAAAGGLETENASTRRGVVGSVVARPTGWLLVSSALSLQTATFDTLVYGVSHDVPNVPSVLWRVDATARGPIARLGDRPLMGRVGVGYTLLAGRHITDTLIGPANNVLNALASLRYGAVEVGVDMYNVLGLKYADDAEYYVSNWSFRPGQELASPAVHIVAAPPRTTLGTVTLYF